MLALHVGAALARYERAVVREEDEHGPCRRIDADTATDGEPGLEHGAERVALLE
jgi:hypothetical protein